MNEAAAVAEASVRRALQAVLDPELGEGIVDLGLVLRVEIAPGCLSPALKSSFGW